MKNTYEALDFMCSLANAIGASLEDGKIGFTDLAELYKPLSKIQLALEGLGEIRKELEGASPDDFAKIKIYILDRFDLPQENIEVFIENLIAGALALVSAVRAIK